MRKEITLNQMYRQLKDAFYNEVSNHQLFKEKVYITCTALSPEEAIGTPDRKDYPIIKKKEVLVEAEFLGSRGQAFTDEFEIGNYSIEELLDKNR